MWIKALGAMNGAISVFATFQSDRTAPYIRACSLSETRCLSWVTYMTESTNQRGRRCMTVASWRSRGAIVVQYAPVVFTIALASIGKLPAVSTRCLQCYAPMSVSYYLLQIDWRNGFTRKEAKFSSRNTISNLQSKLVKIDEINRRTGD